MSAKNGAMVANLTIAMWTARKYDGKVSKRVEEEYAAENSGRYNKILIAKELIAKIQKVVSAARTYHCENTLPWFDAGGRLLPTPNYFEYTSHMQNFRMQFEQCVADFIRTYPDHCEEARMRLGGMYREDDYPDVTELPKKYDFRVQILPVPDADDFRVDLSEDEINNLKSDMLDEIEKNTQMAVRDVWNRLYKVVEHMVERLSSVDSVFRDSLVGNVQEACDLLPRLNFTNDPVLDDMVNEVKGSLAILSPEVLRSDSVKRYEAAAEARKILDKMSAYAKVGG